VKLINTDTLMGVAIALRPKGLASRRAQDYANRLMAVRIPRDRVHQPRAIASL